MVCFLFDYCVTVTAVGDNFEGESGDSNARFSHRYLRDQQVGISFEKCKLFWSSHSLKCSNE